MDYKINDTIELLQDIPEHNLISGEVGVIIMEYKIPKIAYEIEFVNNNGNIKATAVLSSDKFKKL